jgi:hypothetical protein
MQNIHTRETRVVSRKVEKMKRNEVLIIILVYIHENIEFLLEDGGVNESRSLNCYIAHCTSLLS